MQGSLLELDLDAPSLRGNPLGDPSRRTLVAYVPPGAEGRRFPSVTFLHGFTGSGRGWLSPSAFQPTRPGADRRADRARGDPADRRPLPGRVHRRGGTQWIDSPGGRALRRLRCAGRRRRSPTPSCRRSREREARAIVGKSSGGYGALHLGGTRPDVFGFVAAHAADAYFEYCYLPDLPKAAVGAGGGDRRRRVAGGDEAAGARDEARRRRPPGPQRHRDGGPLLAARGGAARAGAAVRAALRADPRGGLGALAGARSGPLRAAAPRRLPDARAASSSTAGRATSSTSAGARGWWRGRSAPAASRSSTRSSRTATWGSTTGSTRRSAGSRRACTAPRRGRDDEAGRAPRHASHRLQESLREKGLAGALLLAAVDVLYYAGTRQNGALWVPAGAAPLPARPQELRPRPGRGGDRRRAPLPAVEGAGRRRCRRAGRVGDAVRRRAAGDARLVAQAAPRRRARWTSRPPSAPSASVKSAMEIAAQRDAAGRLGARPRRDPAVPARGDARARPVGGDRVAAAPRGERGGAAHARLQQRDVDGDRGRRRRRRRARLLRRAGGRAGAPRRLPGGLERARHPAGRAGPRRLLLRLQGLRRRHDAHRGDRGAAAGAARARTRSRSRSRTRWPPR